MMDHDDERLSKRVVARMEEFWIGKIDIARRQISEGVRLFFDERDPVVIHTIIASAHQVLIDIGTRKGIKSAVKNTETLRSEELQRHLKTINYPFNFFKHADRDADGMINIGPLKRFTSDFIMDAIVMLQQIAGDIPIEAKVFWSWFVSKYPQEFDNCSEDGEIKKMQQQRLSDWDNPKIGQFLGYAEIAGEANHSLKPDGSRAGVPNS
jgi:hypothetical protein